MANYLILGASSTIGCVTAHLLKDDESQLFVTGRDKDKIEKLARELDCHHAVLDISDFAATEAVFKAAVEKMGTIDGVVNFAGSLFLKPAHLTSADAYHDVIKTNLSTAFSTVRAAALTMRQSGGSVVLLSSSVAVTGLASHEAIAAAKAGVVGLVRSAAATYASMNLRFNAVAPGLVESALTQPVIATEAARKISEEMHPLGRIGKPEDIASMVAYLLSPSHSWITGQVIAIDGGLSGLHPRMKVQSK